MRRASGRMVLLTATMLALLVCCLLPIAIISAWSIFERVTEYNDPATYEVRQTDVVELAVPTAPRPP